MNLSMTTRERELLGLGLNTYEKNAKAAIGTLAALGVSPMAVEQAIDNAAQVKAQLANTGDGQEIQLTVALRQCARQALTLYSKRVGEVKKVEEQLTIDTSGSESVIGEVEALARRFDDQIDLDEATRPG